MKLTNRTFLVSESIFGPEGLLVSGFSSIGTCFCFRADCQWFSLSWIWYGEDINQSSLRTNRSLEWFHSCFDTILYRFCVTQKSGLSSSFLIAHNGTFVLSSLNHQDGKMSSQEWISDTSPQVQVDAHSVTDDCCQFLNEKKLQVQNDTLKRSTVMAHSECFSSVESPGRMLDLDHTHSGVIGFGAWHPITLYSGSRRSLLYLICVSTGGITSLCHRLRSQLLIWEKVTVFYSLIFHFVMTSSFTIGTI